MRDSLLEDENLTTADIARPGTPRQARAEAMSGAANPPVDQPIQLPASSANPDGVATNTNAAATNPNTGTAITDAGLLFPEDEFHNYRARWDQIQTSFVDEPKRAVEQADSLVANVVKRIAEQFSDERTKLENQWAKGDNVNTEDLRQSLKRYRSFFDRLLSF